MIKSILKKCRGNILKNKQISKYEEGKEEKEKRKGRKKRKL